MATNPPLGTNATDMVSPDVVTPSPRNNTTDTVSPTTVTLLPKQSRRSTRKRGQPASTSVKDNHDNEIEVTTTKPPTKRVGGFTKRKTLVPRKWITNHVVATHRKRRELR
jgi:hypothetical protein